MKNTIVYLQAEDLRKSKKNEIIGNYREVDFYLVLLVLEYEGKK